MSLSIPFILKPIRIKFTILCEIIFYNNCITIIVIRVPHNHLVKEVLLA